MKRVQMPAEPTDLQFKARMTNSQFAALAAAVNAPILINEMFADAPPAAWQKSTTYSFGNTSRWLRNAWNTERVMRIQAELDDESKKFALHWLFPQAYYACYCQLMALFQVIGYTESSHAAVIKRFGTMLQQNRYPKSMTWFATGGMREIILHNVARHRMPSSYYLDIQDSATVQNQIAQLLASTRELHLEQKRQDMRKEFRGKNNAPKKRLSPDDWGRVGDKLGPTSMLGFLYRKRIKANYLDIDTFLETEIAGARITDNLVTMIDGLAIVHEAQIYRAIGPHEYGLLVEQAGQSCSFLDLRHTQ